MNHQHGPNCGCKEYMLKATESLVDLLGCIDMEQVHCLNERVVGDVKKVFKSQEQKQDKTSWVESDSDAELLIIIPFLSNIKLKTITISAKSTHSFP